VKGFETVAATFVSYIRAKGLTVLTDDQVFPHCYGLPLPQKSAADTVALESSGATQ